MLSNTVKELQQRKSQIASQIISLEAEAKKLNKAIKVLNSLDRGVAVAKPARKYKMSPSHRKALIKAQKARWAKIKATAKPAKKKWTMSAAAKAKLSAFHKARWAKIKAAKKK